MNDDETDRSRQSSNASGIVAMLVALPLLYTLSIGPFAFILNKYPSLAPMEKYAGAFYAPVLWLHDHTSLKQPIASYTQWWVRLARKI